MRRRNAGDFDAGTYGFSYKVLNNETFISKGKKYVWCSKSK
jgi:hypothetical protein